MRPPKKFKPIPFPYHHELTLEIDSLTNLGAGVGRVQLPEAPKEQGPWVVFVPFCLPGETVRARIYRNDANCSQADLIEVLTPSPDRVTPRCPLFGKCGGCQYQHLAYPKQLEWKRQQVAELTRRMAHLDIPVLPPVPSPKEWHYRSKLTPHFAKPRDGELGPIGFLAPGTRSRLIDVPQCPIALEPINEALPAIRQEVSKRAHTYKKGVTLLLRAHEEGVETNPRAVISEKVHDLTFHFLAGDFFQNNPAILPAFVDYVAAEAAQDGCTHLVDAYCGSGLFALSLAKHFQQVAGVEVSETSADFARRNAELNQLPQVSIMTASAEEIFADITFPAEETALVIDPPRKGCTPGFLAQLARFGPRRVVYVSCNPATQMRDFVALDEAGYEVEKIQPFDLFPHTRHLECVATLKRK
ncbi:class I SAM-dependent RNA methyltransferase [Roseibacillus ishigakijimensis]|uniref:Class I SAM-dependent RNA methyltransferase n=1 Tax=Roseibacillus ishigakijimensis TaxID=454146 RepID=A0A934RRC5_9BACT|nr:class I SAM-dependent RNA methyltransferase [Roseibacillus ishigakijimensis]MBK1834221.1 class I SAM-dependent RNA methyltransferase [Roseibacillus ishigakijimensis]